MQRFNDSKIALLVWAFVLVLAATSANADFTFGEPAKFGSLTGPEATGTESVDCLSCDGLEMYFDARWSGGQGNWDLWVLKRASKDAVWGAPVNLGPAVNSPGNDLFSSISTDGLALYFCSDQPYGDNDRYEIYVTTRTAKNDPWGPPVSLGPKVNSSSCDACPWISADGLELYFESWRSGGHGGGDIYVTRRATQNDPWGEPANLGAVVNSVYQEVWLSLSPDSLLLLFSDDEEELVRPGGYGRADMWMARRASLSEPWQAPVNLGPRANSPMADVIPRVSPDGRTLYFGSTRSGKWEPWQAPIIPVCDFNGDGQVDGKEVLAMVEHWGQDTALCDIGPFAWGDGVVDLEDLTVLAEYIGKEVVDSTLIAHWALDETEGSVAHDGAGGNDASVLGNPVWRPTGGKVGGALHFDGVGDTVVTQAVPALAQGPFSILAWLIGGSPDRVVLCEAGGADLLSTNPVDGSLMISSPGQMPLSSQAVVTDWKWHRIGLVWDGKNRILCVDGQEVARDTYSALTSGGGLVIGGGVGAGTCWSGSVDDVRIYNRAVIP